MCADSTQEPNQTLPSRTLASEILRTHLLFAAIVGIVALTCVWWVANRVVRDNLDDWSLRWIGELDALGSGLYINIGDERFLTLENYILRFPEIRYIRYYDKEGYVIYVESRSEKIPINELSATQVAHLKQRVEDSTQHVIDETHAPLVRISKAITTESVLTSDLFSTTRIDDMITRSAIAGYVELGLDYSNYDRALLKNIITGSLIIFTAFGLLVGFGWWISRRAVKPLTIMEGPLLKLAGGDFDISVPTTAHREIAVIGNALKTAALNIQDRDKYLRKLAFLDSLTGMPNRRHFFEQFSESLRKKGGALLFMDLDQFKYVNDTYGHAAGDEILIQCAKKIQQAMGPNDLIARLGGDEFVIFIPGVSTKIAADLAKNLLSELGKYPLNYNGNAFTIGCSIGVAMVETDNIYTRAELVSHADYACRQAKQEGRNCMHLYNESERELDSKTSQITWRQRIQNALLNNGFELHYQAIMHTRDESVNHQEVLLRLREGNKLYSPEVFLSAAERSGLMKDIDRWVIEKAMSELVRERKSSPNLRFSLNIAGNTFADGSFPNFVKFQLKRFSLPASSVIFEITEQLAIGSFSNAIPQIEELVDTGCEFAVDDFGTGYSSLNYLKQLPVQYVKIDGAFISNICESKIDQTIVQAITDIARILDMKTVAEYVNSKETMEMAKTIGIDYVQGYYIGEPAPMLAKAGQENIIHWPTMLKNNNRT